MFFTKLYDRIERLEISESSFVDCKVCKAVIIRFNAHTVYFRNESLNIYHDSHYCGLCAPEYDKISESGNGTKKYTKSVFEEVEVFPEEKSK